ncbi:restriction endonuclease subunit S [Mesorhizobium sp. WSM3866]|uniref:restriction endonuclease subunit S n=1 Tax=Mesorhizobium sp. WSM3866 TaxID=422271 RepID=UPI000BB055EC|nr:restriction endonuclease subunit S [Mesorhizobium sp. WSM3866]PBB41305.1 restriction endonuclease subunit S [Mesorhizobium sp. WSM3866]
MRAGWDEAPLERIAAFRSGLWVGKKGPFSTAKVIRNTNIKPNGKLSLDDVAEIEVEKKQLQSRLLEFGDIILERSGGGPKQPVGRAVCFELNESGYSFSNFTSVIRVIDKKRVSYRFLHLVLNWWYNSGVTEKIQSNSTGIRNLDFTAYKALHVPIPPLERQLRLVALLDEAFEGLDRARAHAEANLQNTRELFESALHRALSDSNGEWEVKPLGELGLIQTGSTPKTSEPGNFGDHVPFIKPGDFRSDGTLDYYNFGLSEKGAKVSRLVAPGSALMVCIGATIGKTGFTDRAIATNQQINAITPTDGVLGEYLYYQMLTPEFQAAVIHKSGQATLPIINKSKWSQLSIRVPLPRERQAAIVESMNRLRQQQVELISTYQGKLAYLSNLRRSLMEKAVSGELE